MEPRPHPPTEGRAGRSRGRGRGEQAEVYDGAAVAPAARGAGVPVSPPPHWQHIVFATKSASSYPPHHAATVYVSQPPP